MNPKNSTTNMKHNRLHIIWKGDLNQFSDTIIYTDSTNRKIKSKQRGSRHKIDKFFVKTLESARAIVNRRNKDNILSAQFCDSEGNINTIR